MEENKLNIRVEYEPTPIRHLSIKCPFCNNWFKKNDIAKNDIDYITDLTYDGEFKCPNCKKEFDSSDYELNIVECDNHNEVYKDCLTKKVIWEK